MDSGNPKSVSFSAVATMWMAFLRSVTLNDVGCFPRVSSNIPKRSECHHWRQAESFSAFHFMLLYQRPGTPSPELFFFDKLNFLLLLKAHDYASRVPQFISNVSVVRATECGGKFNRCFFGYRIKHGETHLYAGRVLIKKSNDNCQSREAS